MSFVREKKKKLLPLDRVLPCFLQCLPVSKILLAYAQLLNRDEKSFLEEVNPLWGDAGGFSAVSS